MGNSSSKNDEIIHPKFLGHMPKPWDLSKIEPQIVVCRKNKEKIVITHEMSEEMAINSLIESELLPTNRIIFIAHGFLTTQYKPWLHSMKDLMIEEKDQTVCIIGWGNGADIGIFKYEQASANALAVGQWLAKYAKALRQRFNDLYIWGIGHSLGAHLMGMSGRESQVFDRITGLDPAGVGFQVENEDKRLNFSDAKLVDVIHSDGKNVPYFGTLLPLGSIDFYPNYGWNQPNYDDSNKKPYMFESQDEPKAEQISPYGDGFTTSHGRAIDYFIWSIVNKGKFKTNMVLETNPSVEKAVHRLKCVEKEREMGYYANESFDQNEEKKSFPMCYYVVTNAREPWL